MIEIKRRIPRVGQGGRWRYWAWNRSNLFTGLVKDSIVSKQIVSILPVAIRRTFIKSPTCSTCVIDIVGLPPFFFISSSGSYKVLPTFVTTCTFASRASRITSASRPFPYVSVSFSKTRCVMRHAFHNFGKSVCGASRMRKSFDLGLSFVIDFDKSLWHSIL